MTICSVTGNCQGDNIKPFWRGQPFVGVQLDCRSLHSVSSLFVFEQINFLQMNHRKYGSIQGRAQISGLRKKEETKTIM